GCEGKKSPGLPSITTVWKNSRNSWPGEVGKNGGECPMMSVCLCGPSYMKRTARPRGWALGSLSGIAGRPVELEKRLTTGEDGWLKCGAFERALASAVGVKVPFSNIP